MSKSKTTVNSVLEDKKRLCAADYWEWRCSIEELQHSKTKHLVKQAELQCFKNSERIASLEYEVFKYRYKLFEEQAECSQKEYNNFKARLEEKIGFSLNGCSISPDTFEVNKL